MRISDWSSDVCSSDLGPKAPNWLQSAARPSVLPAGHGRYHRLRRDRLGGDHVPGGAGRDGLFQRRDLRAVVLAQALRVGELFARDLQRALGGERPALTGLRAERVWFGTPRVGIQDDRL